MKSDLECMGLPPELCTQLEMESQVIKIKLEHRKMGKVVTIVEGIDDKTLDLKKLASYLKTKLAAGGTIKNGRIEIQGDHRSRLKKILTEELGFKPENIVFIEEE
ncbi:stress response translation initiation inhibitor YciH [Ignisphaera sp. 4213-co]|uniref:Protein translation factor SUI1 homolog n=1 Tax=Ignisphaera cupida TaxID=3050454 RepID=A0ABD4Z615_9CREN|nr:stress response translation initiation inhibitor YciH [Ignisphaera sp. 4213-co]MDK6028452.1 stress response translation initiation inhibitor YciH [Ignisphaera sp. 4213-co]